MFIVADSQLHELRGKRSGVHLDLVDSAVPVAVRPVELDLLSGAPLRRFAEIYRSLRDTRFPGMRWMHIGDFADLGCSSEARRALAYLDAFGFDRCVGLVPGNHDSAFVGNFTWHPDWVSACRPVRATSRFSRTVRS